MVNDNSDLDLDSDCKGVDFLEVADLFEAMKSLEELSNPYYDIDPEDKVYIDYELSRKDDDKVVQPKGDYKEMQKQICEEKLYEVLAHYNASHMTINPSQGHYDIAPDDYVRGKKERRGILRVYADTGFATVQSFKADSQFNVGGKPLNITLDYFRKINFNLHDETLKRLTDNTKSFINVGKKEAKKAWNREAWDKFLYSERTNLLSDKQYIDKNIVLDFIDDYNKKVLILQGRTGMGKSSLGFEIARLTNVCNIVVVPFVSIKKGKYEIFYNDPSATKEKLRNELKKLGIEDEDQIEHIINCHADKRIMVFCPEGYINKCELDEITRINRDNGIKTIVTIDEAHSILGKTQYRDSYVTLFIDVCECIRKYDLKVILMSATINNFTYYLFKEKAKLDKTQIDWINFIPKGQNPLNVKVDFIPHNNDPQEAICQMIDFYKSERELPLEEQGKCAIAVSNVAYINGIKEAFNNDWESIDNSIGIDLYYATLFKIGDISKLNPVARNLYRILENNTHNQELLDKILSVTKSEIESDMYEYQYTYLTKQQYDLVTRLINEEQDKKGKPLSAEYVLYFMAKRFIRPFRPKHIDELMNNNKLMSMFSFFTSSGFEGIDIFDPKIKKIIFICNDVTHDDELIRQFFGRFRLQLQDKDFVFEVLIPNAKTNRRVQTLYSVMSMFKGLINADGAFSMCNHDEIYKDMVVNHRISTIVSISEMLKRAKMQWIKNHHLITDYFASNDLNIVELNVKNTSFYKGLEGTEDRAIKVAYNEKRNFQRLFYMQDVIRYNNNIINWLNGNKNEVAEHLQRILSRDFGSVCEFTKEHDKEGYLYNTLRIRDFAQNIARYIQKLNLANKKFDIDTCIQIFRHVKTLNKHHLEKLRQKHNEKIKLLISLKAGIQGETDEETAKKQLSKSYQIKQEVINQLKADIKNIMINVDPNAKRVFMFDPENVLLNAMYDGIFHINYKEDLIISFVDLANGYRTDEKAIKGIIKHDLKNKSDDDIIKKAREIIFSEDDNIKLFGRDEDEIHKHACKVNKRNEFKSTLNNYDVSIITKLLDIEAKKKTGKSFCWTKFEKDTIKKRKLYHGSQYTYRDCVTKKYNYLVINFIDTLKNGKTRLIKVPFKIKAIKLMLLNETKASPPLGMEI